MVNSKLHLIARTQEPIWKRPYSGSAPPRSCFLTGHLKNQQIGELFGLSNSAGSHAVKSVKSKLAKDQRLQTKFDRLNSLFKLWPHWLLATPNVFNATGERHPTLPTKTTNNAINLPNLILIFLPLLINQNQIWFNLNTGIHHKLNTNKLSGFKWISQGILFVDCTMTKNTKIQPCNNCIYMPPPTPQQDTQIIEAYIRQSSGWTWLLHFL